MNESRQLDPEIHEAAQRLVEGVRSAEPSEYGRPVFATDDYYPIYKAGDAVAKDKRGSLFLELRLDNGKRYQGGKVDTNLFGEVPNDSNFVEIKYPVLIDKNGSDATVSRLTDKRAEQARKIILKRAARNFTEASKDSTEEAKDAKSA